LALLTALAAVVAASVVLSRAFRRTFNNGLVAAACLVLVMMAVIGLRMAGAMSDAANAVRGPLQSADRAAQARAAGFDARAQEALTLVNRGNGAANELAWQQASDVVLDVADEPDRSAYEVYMDSHARMRSVDDAGQWEEAVAASRGEVGEQFATFDQGVTRAIADGAERAQRRFDSADDLLRSGRWLTIVLGGLAASLAAVGVGARLKEYR
jgi:hypothetical protein